MKEEDLVGRMYLGGGVRVRGVQGMALQHGITARASMQTEEWGAKARAGRGGLRHTPARPLSQSITRATVATITHPHPLVSHPGVGPELASPLRCEGLCTRASEIAVSPPRVGALGPAADAAS